MIGMIKGQVAHLSAPVACIMTAGGVAYDVELSVPSFCTLSLGDETTLFTHLHVREDAHLLFGFTNRQDRDIFRKLIKINGVGAKMALAMLSALSATQLKEAVEYGDDTALVRVPGIGKKTAQRLIIELKGKLELDSTDPLPTAPIADIAPKNPMYIIHEVESALISLGYKEKEAQTAIKSARQSLEEQGVEMDTSNLLKASLKTLSGF